MALTNSITLLSFQAAVICLVTSASFGSAVYPDGRAVATLRYDAQDQGVVLPYGHCPSHCDKYGARDVWVFEDKGRYFMHYDGAGETGWLSSLSTSRDLVHWKKKGPVLRLGLPGQDDSATASYGTTFFDDKTWHMFYIGSPHATPPPDRIPMFPYLTLKARSSSPSGPWTKEPEVIPFRPQPGSYYSATASAGQIIRDHNQYLQFFSASVDEPDRRNQQFSGSGVGDSIQRTLGIARTTNLEGAWTVDSSPILPLSEQVENSSLYYEQSNGTWFLFTNHIGLDRDGEYTDAIWVYWTKSLNHWDTADKAIVLDGKNCKWSKRCIGLPSVIRFGKKLAIFYDAPGGESVSHMKRSIGLAWLQLPLSPPTQ
jgi:predicted GH43/DUF377 family glycosyl hydrolase